MTTPVAPARRASDVNRTTNTILGAVLALIGAGLAVLAMFKQITFTSVLLGAVLILVFVGGALVQGVTVDTILALLPWKKDGPTA